MKTQMIILLVLIALGVIKLILTAEPSDIHCKRFVINHKDEIIKEGSFYKIMHSDRKYYKDVTIRRFGTDGYSVIFWGDRDNWLWRFRLDKYFNADVPYRQSKHKDVLLDKEILEILTNLENVKQPT
jgi:hypothetical protein